MKSTNSPEDTADAPFPSPSPPISAAVLFEKAAFLSHDGFLDWWLCGQGDNTERAAGALADVRNALRTIMLTPSATDEPWRALQEGVGLEGDNGIERRKACWRRGMDSLIHQCAPEGGGQVALSELAQRFFIFLYRRLHRIAVVFFTGGAFSSPPPPSAGVLLRRATKLAKGGQRTKRGGGSTEEARETPKDRARGPGGEGASRVTWSVRAPIPLPVWTAICGA